MTRTKCVVCGRARIHPDEGRWIDGSWPQDAILPKRFRGKWVCCFRCYERIFEDLKAGLV